LDDSNVKRAARFERFRRFSGDLRLANDGQAFIFATENCDHSNTRGTNAQRVNFIGLVIA
jgi:hypothetical protein